jgi:hypothetical protein
VKKRKKEKKRLHTAVTTLSGEHNFPIRKKKNQFKLFSTSENKTKKKRSNVPSPAHHLHRQTYWAMKISHSQAPQQQPNKETKQNKTTSHEFSSHKNRSTKPRTQQTLKLRHHSSLAGKRHRGLGGYQKRSNPEAPIRFSRRFPFHVVPADT